MVDCGIAFPEDDMLGIDLVIPDITYLKNNKDKIKGIVLTHGHEDHIGSVPYVLKEIGLGMPIYGTKLTLGLLENKLEEHKILSESNLQVVSQGERVDLGAFRVEFIRSSHSIADSVALAIHTPIGVIVHTSDFKIDYTPIEGEPIDLARFAELGKKGVLLLMCDSTNAEREGYTMSESIVGEAFEKLFVDAKGRIIVATFASNIHRVQQIIDSAVKYGRKVAVCGRSMINVVNIATRLGYLKVPQGTMVDIQSIGQYSHDKLVLITTGSQGEPMSALTRMAGSSHRQVQIVPGDMVVISATPIPGNEKMISNVINQLFQKGAKVIYHTLMDIHVSGHACQEELKLIHSLVKPKFFMPVHGEYKHLKQHALLAESLGMDKKNIFLLEIGRVLEVAASEAKIGGTVPAGRVFVDGLGVGDVGNIVLRDRKHLSQDGLVIILISIDKETGMMLNNPEVVSRGFVYVREADQLMDQIKQVAKQKVMDAQGQDWSTIKNNVKYAIRQYLDVKTKRDPMILPIIIEV